MKYLAAFVMLLAAPVTAKACDPLGVCSQGVAVQSFGVLGSHVQVQSFVPHVQAVHVANIQAFAVPQVFVQNVGHCGVASVRSLGHVGVASVRVAARAPRVVIQNVRPPRQTVRTRTVVRQR
jgi:hypothetical protein